jgi:hypothetical protein
MDWQELTRMTGGQPIRVERVRAVASGIAIEGDFEVPPLAALAAEDQVFVAAFVRSHGSIKEMERLFGVSYPTVKARLERISAALPLVTADVPSTRRQALDDLEAGRISVADAIERLR